MDCHQRSSLAGGNVVGFQHGNSENSANENHGIRSVETSLKSNQDGRLLQMEVGSEPSNKRARTGVCCPYASECNFAYSEDQLRMPPPNWQEFVEAREKEQLQFTEQREGSQIPIMECGDEREGSAIRQHCKKFLTKEGCSFGDNCTFRHDEHYQHRQSEAICLVPGTGDVHASHWKTKLCDKWLKGKCQFGSDCNFAHGSAELRPYHRKPWNAQPSDGSPSASQQVPDAAKAAGVSSRRPLTVPHTPGLRPKWKGPDKISKIYGDWIDDL